MGFNNLSLELGAKILREEGVEFSHVLQVHFNVDWDRGYSTLTPGWAEYPVTIDYSNNEPTTRQYRKVYEGLYQIIRELEDLDDEIRFD